MIKLQLEEEIDKLCAGGLKNRTHTLTLSRLMVRSRELEHRTRLLRVIQSGEQPCRRLFLDYHGLRLIWSYMMDLTDNSSAKGEQFRLEILKTLKALPIPNKTMLMDSKIYKVVENWAKKIFVSPNDSPEDDQSKVKINEELENNCDSNEKVNLEKITDIAAGDEKEVESEVKVESNEMALIVELADSLLAEWANLKEVFRIPKKERIEQMKEHEREAGEYIYEKQIIQLIDQPYFLCNHFNWYFVLYFPKPSYLLLFFILEIIRSTSLINTN